MDANLAVIQTGNLQPIKDLVLDALNSDESKTAYNRALDGFLTWYAEGGYPELCKAAVQAYKKVLQDKGLSPATINLQLSAIRKLAVEAKDNKLIDADLAIGISEVRGVKSQGVRVGNWLNKKQAEDLIKSPDQSTIMGLRDRAILAVLIGCWVRRTELVNMTFEQIQQRENRWVIADLVGKGNHIRTVPMPTWAKTALDQWAEAAGISSGLVFRSIHRGGRVNGSMTAQAIRNITKKYGNIAPHDLRRTGATLARKAHAPLEQIQITMGHQSTRTTERYLHIEQDFSCAPCDYITLEI